MREPRFSRVEHLGVWDWPGDGPCILMCHATGLHSRCWDEIIRRLPENVRVVAPDMRGHGRSENPAPPGQPARWKDFGEDMAMLVDALRLEKILGVGHSMGGHSVVHAATLRPSPFAALLLLDPVILAPERYGVVWMENHYARKRRNQWTSASEMYERFKDRLPFSLWNPQVLRDYCDHALNGNVLTCVPDFEASIYENSWKSASDITSELGVIAAPVTIMRSHLTLAPGEVDMNASVTDPKLATRFQRSRDIEVPLGHFFPQEQPGMIAKIIETEFQ